MTKLNHREIVLFVTFVQVCDRSRSPQWNEAFCFLVRDPVKDMLIIKVAALSTSAIWGLPPKRHKHHLHVFFSSSCPVRGTSQWELWSYLSRICFLNHSWFWISGSVWMALYPRVRFCWEQSWRYNQNTQVKNQWFNMQLSGLLAASDTPLTASTSAAGKLHNS